MMISVLFQKESWNMEMTMEIGLRESIDRIYRKSDINFKEKNDHGVFSRIFYDLNFILT